MEKIKLGEVIELSNGKEYLCFSDIEENNINYIYLITTKEPIEVMFAKHNINSDDDLELIMNQEEKQYVFELFQKHGLDKFDNNI